MHKNDFFLFIFFSYRSFSLSYLELQIIFPCRDIGPATTTLNPRPRHWTRDRDFGPVTRDLRPATISQIHLPLVSVLNLDLSRWQLSKQFYELFARTKRNMSFAKPKANHFQLPKGQFSRIIWKRASTSASKGILLNIIPKKLDAPLRGLICVFTCHGQIGKYK